MKINPMTSLVLNLLYVMALACTVGTLTAMGIPNASQVAAWMAFAAIPLNAVLHGFSSTESGPLSSDRPKV